MNSREEFEIEKIKLEIAQMKAPFWKKSNILISVATILVSVIIGFSSYFASVDQKNVALIEDLKSKIKENETIRQRIEVENLNLQKTKFQANAEELEKKYNEAQAKLDAIEKEIKSRNTDLTVAKKDLLAARTDLSTAKKDYVNYKKKVEDITTYMHDYGIGYAEGILKSESGRKAMEKIARLPDNEERKKEIESFAIQIVRQTFDKYTSKKSGELELKR